jgi:hypothetical protein
VMTGSATNQGRTDFWATGSRTFCTNAPNTGVSRLRPLIAAAPVHITNGVTAAGSNNDARSASNVERQPHRFCRCADVASPVSDACRTVTRARVAGATTDLLQEEGGGRRRGLHDDGAWHDAGPAHKHRQHGRRRRRGVGHNHLQCEQDCRRVWFESRQEEHGQRVCSARRSSVTLLKHPGDPSSTTPQCDKHVTCRWPALLVLVLC